MHGTPTAAAADGARCNMCNARSNFATSRGNTYNIYPKQLKQCNIHLKHLHKHIIAIAKYMQHPDETLAI
jgi:hypothetical protein